ncbi:pyridoxal phosphate-dependent decarboxylase family protein [Myceligenerans xiligouense]|uniref:L-2,4-diaminobutyrate decarboxylase n=1 Tax=Myceligenerans xiligouense TaxID=253184 RepID=A0A3N4YK73_9MICO|nr:pyridoxal-dependent decarboxylase [Myceligenerans xiligouense]RPF21509.1 L-2,4-diaminobutyrate decarboxylase [Myceligenerans xiligouense]
MSSPLPAAARGVVPVSSSAASAPPSGARHDRSALLRGATAAEYARVTRAVVDDVAGRVAAVTQPFAGAGRAELGARCDAVDLDAPGVGTEEALAEAADLYAGNAVWYHHPAYAAHLNCPVAVPAVAAEAMLAAINTSVDTYDQSGAATLMERRLVDWTAGRIGFPVGRDERGEPAGADGVFTSGGTQSNLQAMFLARQRALDGLGGVERAVTQSRLRILATAASHFSVAKSALLLGLSEDAVVDVDVDGDGRMDPDALGRALTDVARAGDTPMAVVATAGTTDRGCVDPILPLADLADATGAWLHVDAAYGCGLLVSPTRRGLLAGIERARSVTVDFHKAFFQPVSSSALIVREATDMARGSWHADYLNPERDNGELNPDPNQVGKSLQTTRRFDALKLWVTLRALGADGVGRLADATYDLAAAVHADLADDPQLRLVARTDLSTVMFRYEPDGLAPEHADALVSQVRRVLFDSGRALVAKTVADGRPCLKLTLLDPDMTLDDVRAVLDLVRSAAQGLLAGEELAGLDVPPCRDVHPRLTREETD